MKKSDKKVIGIDPGLTGAIVVFDGHNFEAHNMPLVVNGKDRRVSFDGVHEVIYDAVEGVPGTHIFLERAMPMAMGAKHAFNYGRDFAALEIAIELIETPVIYVEPGKWSKVMHQGVDSRLKPKAKSLVALKRLYPKLYGQVPTNRNGKLHEGIVDALLIAGYGLKLT